jgi:osmoprotectant transport system ATP-binding protein
VDLGDAVTATVGEPTDQVVRRAHEAGQAHVILLDSRGRPVRWPSLGELERSSTVRGDVDGKLSTVGLRATLNDASTRCWCPATVRPSSPAAGTATSG